MRDQLRAQRDEILRVATSYGATNVRVFGSVARGDATRTSDVDLLVELEEAPGSPPMLLRVAGLAEDLTTLLGVKVDVATEQLLRDDVRAEALATAVPV
jgi:predicted nucleotidyltransferase